MTLRAAHEPDGSHRFTMATGYILGRTTSSEGAVEEIPTSGAGSLFVLKAGDTMTGTLTMDSGVAAEIKVTLDNGGYIVKPTTTSGGWARGVRVQKNSDSTELGGAGFYGNNEAITQYAIGFGSTWYTGNNAALVVDKATQQTLLNGYNLTSQVLTIDSTGSPYIGWKRSGTRDFYLQSDSAAVNLVGETNRPMSFYTNGTLRLSIPGAAAGLTFPAAQAASSDANTLDDYEEGTWSPGTPTAGLSVSANNGSTYVKIGQYVYAQCYVNLNNTSGAAINTFVINGLPFTNANGYYNHAYYYYTNMGTPGARTYSYVDSNSTQALFGGAATQIATGSNGYMFAFHYRATA